MNLGWLRPPSFLFELRTELSSLSRVYLMLEKLLSHKYGLSRVKLFLLEQVSCGAKDLSFFKDDRPVELGY